MGASLCTVFEVYRAHLYIQRRTIQMKDDDDVTMPHLVEQLVPDLDRTEADCGKNVKPDEYGYYIVNDMVMSKEAWIEYCNDIKSDRKILEQDLESRSDNRIPNSILRVKVWYDNTLMSHPKINGNKNKANEFLDKAMEEAQKLLCLDSFGFRLTMRQVAQVGLVQDIVTTVGPEVHVKDRKSKMSAE